MDRTYSRSYEELIKLKTFEERLEYLLLNGQVGIDTFGFDRYLNQILYNTKEWRDLRYKVITRDAGCNLGVDGYEIIEKPLIHHINPISVEDIVNRNPKVLDMNNLITTNQFIHNIIHYGSIEDIRQLTIVERKKNDTCPWRK